MVEVHLYGRLRRHAPDPRPDRESVVRVATYPGETVIALLLRIGVSPPDVHHVFLNGALLATHNSMARWLGYQPPPDDAQGLHTPLEPGDRLGLFGADMALLVV